MKWIQLHIYDTETNPVIWVNIGVVVYLQKSVNGGTLLMLPYGTLEVTETPAQIRQLANGTP